MSSVTVETDISTLRIEAPRGWLNVDIDCFGTRF